ncbi:site-specific integrase [Hyphomonas sp. NPDC076900]|uniref:site-specific integrase n=1 Tax=unclassified Hyphomonas TaxID=2630699 RepID=UPI003D05F985
MKPTIEIDVKPLLNRFFESLLANYSPPGGFAPGERSDHRIHIEGAAERQSGKYAAMLEQNDYPAYIQADAEQLLSDQGLSLADVSALTAARLLEGIVRARMEEIRHGIYREDDLFGAYSPEDNLFQKKVVQLASANPAPPTPSSDYFQGGTGGTLSVRIQQYLEADESRPATIREKRVVLNWLAEHLGPERDVRAITNEHVLEFQKLLVQLKVNTPSETPLAKAVTPDGSKRVHTKTAKKKFDTAKAFFRWLEKMGAVNVAPGNKLQVKVKKTPNSEKRRPFEPHEVNQLFSSPMFTGYKSAKKRHVPGPYRVKDDQFWMPLVLLYSGMRLAEPLQIAAQDVFVDCDHPHFNIDLAKLTLKQDVSDRLVPIHPDLIAFGFGDFVRNRQKQKPGERLFRGITSEGTSIPNYYSKVIGRYIDRAGLKDPRIVAHSFRHTFKDALRNAKVPEGEQHFIMGHSDSEAAHNYGSGSKIDVLWSYVEQLDLGLSEDVKAKLRKK